MNIINAVRLAKRGMKMRRKSWTKGNYLFLEDSDNVTLCLEWEPIFAPGYEEFMADDWVACKTKKKKVK